MKNSKDSGFKAKKITRSYRQSINAPSDVIFPLLCPVREAEWFDGWEYEMIHSESGLAEEGCVFITPCDDEEDTVWVISLYDKARRKIDFTRFTPGSRICVLDIAVTPRGETGSNVDISYNYTGVSAAGNTWIDNFTEEAFLEAVKFWEKSMNHFLGTGKRLKK